MAQQAPGPSSYGRFEKRSDDKPGLLHRLADNALNIGLVGLLVAFLAGLGWGLWWWLFAPGEEHEGTRVSAEYARVGDCVPSLQQGSVYYVDVVPCSEPHLAEAYAEFELPPGPWPGDEGSAIAGEVGCRKRFADFVGTPFARSELQISTLVPSLEIWELNRGVVCWVTLPGDQLATGTLRNSRR